MDRAFIGQGVGWLVGLAAAALTAYVMFGGGQGLGLPSGRYPVILLIALAVGPPLIVGAIAGGAAFGIVYVALGPVENAASERRANDRARAAEELNALVRRPLTPEAAGALVDGELKPVLRRLGVRLEEPSWPYRPSPLHLAAAAGNMALIEAIGQRAPKILAPDDLEGKVYFVDAAPAGRQDEALAAFVRGLSRAIEKSMGAQDRPVSDDDRAMVVSHLAQRMERARAQGPTATLTLDLEQLKAGPVSEARARGGLAALDEGRHEQAVALLDSAIRLDPSYARAFVLRGRAHAALGHREQAIADYGEAARLLPTLAEAVMRRGHVREEANDLEQALTDYQEALRIDPKYAPGYISRGAFFFNRRNQISPALDDFRRALELDPGNQLASGNIAAVLQAQGADDANSCARERSDPGGAAQSRPKGAARLDLPAARRNRAGARRPERGAAGIAAACGGAKPARIHPHERGPSRGSARRLPAAGTPATGSGQGVVAQGLAAGAARAQGRGHCQLPDGGEAESERPGAGGSGAARGGGRGGNVGWAKARPRS